MVLVGNKSSCYSLHKLCYLSILCTYTNTKFDYFLFSKSGSFTPGQVPYDPVIAALRKPSELEFMLLTMTALIGHE
jgi:hypothetical protein